MDGEMTKRIIPQLAIGKNTDAVTQHVTFVHKVASQANLGRRRERTGRGQGGIE